MDPPVAVTVTALHTITTLLLSRLEKNKHPVSLTRYFLFGMSKSLNRYSHFDILRCYISICRKNTEQAI
jgi:hypothetical protein